MQAYHADLTYESMQREGSEEYLCTRNPVETDGSRSDLHQQSSFSCLREPHVPLLYFARTLDTCRQEVGWRNGGRRTILPMKRRSLPGLLWIFSDFLWRQTICNHRGVSISLFLSRKQFSFCVFITITKNSSFFFSPSYFFLSENQFSALFINWSG